MAAADRKLVIWRARLSRGVRRWLRTVTVSLSPRYRPSLGSYLVLAPHPDDESLGCGGTIAALRAQNVDVTVAIVTDGAGSDKFDRDAHEVRDARRLEAIEACRVLGVDADHIRFVGLPDGRLDAMADELDTYLHKLCDELRPDEVLVCSDLDRHPDHRALNAACARAAFGDIRVTEYLVWAWSGWPLAAYRMKRNEVGRGRAGAEIAKALLSARRQPLGNHRDTKKRAIECHVSQLGDGAPGRGISRPMVEEHLGAYEVLILRRRPTKNSA